MADPMLEVPDQGPGVDGEGDTLDTFLREIDLTQAQVATLLGVSQQAVSKWKEEGPDTLGKQGRAQRLYQALTVIGGERYTVSAVRLKEMAARRSWGVVDATAANTVLPATLYAEADELWFVSDSPANVIDWDALRKVLFVEANQKAPGQKVVAFFVKTLEGAERWAEALERELIAPAATGEQVQPGLSAKAACYIYIIATNTVSYGGDLVIANAGSRCMGVTGALRPMQAYSWTGSAYARAGAEVAGFVALAHQNRLGMGALKEHFFPHGTLLTSDILNFGHVFMDGMIAVRGPRPTDDESVGGDNLAGGLLGNTVGRPEQTLAFNKQAKFCPVFIQCYRRKPDEPFNKNPKRTLRIVQEELDRKREQAAGREAPAGQSAKFW